MSDLGNSVIINKLENVYEEIQGNWTDEIGKQYLLWLEKTITTLKDISVKTQLVDQEAWEIYNGCEKIINDNDNEPKTKIYIKKM